MDGRLHTGIGRAARRGAALLLSAVMAFAVAACGAGTSGDTGDDVAAKTGAIDVVASVNQWGSLAAEIGGKDVKVTSILSSTGVDAHDFEPKTSDLATLSKAEVVVANGAGYDSWATKTRGPDSTLVSAAQIVGAMDGDNPHLWFSKDARKGMAKELANAFSKARPKKRKAFETRLKAWQKREKTLDQAMDDFSSRHKDLSYGATEAVVYYLMSDMSFEDRTPKAYAQAVANGGEIAPADLQTFQSLIEDHGMDVLVNNSQEASDATNMLVGTAGRSDVPVVDVSEQMPAKYDTLTDWIGKLVEELFTAVDPDYDVDDPDGTAQDGDDADTGGNDGTTQDESTESDGTDGSTADADGSGCSNGDGTGDCTATGDDGSNAGQTDPGK
ncbi:metal ABC transporter solute-binding protein, Zn/Mn family [Bifidobacterium saguinibicoloris]|uniref:metal ABC transporter solute-binding protein, Zn/Mn family n=1 Tax=Bifidobacterium saguinibicoloris TaxID=2834433 RepID=UPI001F264102|nr:zinc ABC transporter substrate-binding protein [Bifidobacterium saguinibicoloris]